MRLHRVFALSVMALALATPAARGETAFADPPVLALKGEHAHVTLDAFVGWVDVPGLGRVEGASFYDLNDGQPADGGAAPTPRRRSLMPRVLQVDPGMTLEVELRNHLTTIMAGDPAHPMPDATNIHTHGLIVPPTGLGFGNGGTPRLGDCVYPLAASTAPGMPHGMGHGEPVTALAFDPCARAAPLPGMADMDEITAKGGLAYSYAIAKDHPSGLFWIHPHPHGQSEIQLSNGLSGLLAIGSIWDYLSFTCRPTASPYDPTGACRTQEDQRTEIDLERRAAHDPDGVKVRYIGLKDVQVTERADSTSEHPHFDLIAFPHRPAEDATAAAKQAFGDANDARKALCGDLAPPQGDPGGDIALPGGARADGICWAPQDAAKPAPRSGWAFTVSGAVHPRIAITADMELWRIANMSADVTYRLQLVGGDGKPLDLQPVALDGVALATPSVVVAPATAQARAGGVSASGRGVTEITLMPSARTEVLVRRCGHGEVEEAGCLPATGAIKARLRTRGVFTGATKDDGDAWPAIDLADVEWAAPSARHEPVRRLQVTAAVSASAPEAAAATGSPAVVAVASPAPRTTSTTASPCHPEAYDHGYAPFSVNAPRARLIRLNNHSFDEEAFGIHDEVLALKSKTLGAPVRISDLVEEGGSPPDASGAAPKLADVDLDDACQAAATNFDGTDASLPPATADLFKTYYRPFAMDVDNVTTHHGTTEYWLVVNDAPECHNFHIHQMKFAVLDADFVGGAAESLNQCAGDRKAERPINQRALQDNVPLPPYARVLLKIDFDGPKLGRFVFHCHILEHEDKGMMATIRVADPAEASAGAPN